MYEFFKQLARTIIGGIAKKEVSYVCVYIDSQNHKAAVQLEEYFNGDKIKQLSEKINRCNRFMVYDIPVYDNLFEARMYLGRHGRGGEEARYILVIDAPRDTALELLRENSPVFQEKIMHAINWSDLIKEHKKYKYDAFSSDKESFSKVQVYNNPNIKIVRRDSVLVPSEQSLQQTGCTIL